MHLHIYVCNTLPLDNPKIHLHTAPSYTTISAQGISQVVGSFDGEPTIYGDWIELIEEYMLLGGVDDSQSKRLAYQTSRGAIRDHIQRYMAEYPENILEQLKSDMLAANIIHSSRSPWSFPTVICWQKGWHLEIQVLSSWPLPVIDDMLAALGKAKYFTTLDLKSGYWQIPLNEEDNEKMVLPFTEVCMSTMSCLLV